MLSPPRQNTELAQIKSKYVPAAVQAAFFFLLKMQQECVLMLLTNFTSNVSGVLSIAW